jgi:hypothetical protein
MKRAIPIIALALLVVVVGAVPSLAGKPTATLIDVDELLQARGNNGRPAGSANCANDDASRYTGAWSATGWTVQGSLDAHLNTATIPAGLGSGSTVANALQASYNAWTGVPQISVKTGGTATRYGANRLDELLFGKTGGSIATTYTWRWSDGFIESDVVFSTQVSWFMAGSEGDGCVETAGAKYDLQNIAVHEVGHVYGLGHVNGRFESQYTYGFTGETLKRTPTTGEKNGLASLY